jgi:hypothetical protein
MRSRTAFLVGLVLATVVTSMVLGAAGSATAASRCDVQFIMVLCPPGYVAVSGARICNGLVTTPHGCYGVGPLTLA